MKRRVLTALMWMCTDAFIILLAYTTAYTARALTAPLDLISSLPFISFAIITTIVAAYFSGVYHHLWSHIGGHGIVLIIIPGLASTFVTFMVAVFLNPRPVPLSVVLMGNIFAFIGMVTIRYRSRLITGATWRWKAIWDHEFPTNVVRVMIIGGGESGESVARRLSHRNFNNNNDEKKSYKILGFIDDDEEKHGFRIEGYRVLGSREDIPELVEEYKVDLIILAIHNIEGESFREIQNLCWDANVKVKIVPDTVGSIWDSKPAALKLRDVRPEDILGRSQISRHKDVDLSPVTNKTILLTGAAGSIGSELSRQMGGYDPKMLIILDNNESALHDLQVELITMYPDITVKPVLADVTQGPVIRKVFEQYRPDVVYHAAAYKHVPMMEWYPNQAIRVNVGGTLAVAELAGDFDAERFVLISTDKAVNPSSVMGASKRLCELVIRALSQQNRHETLYTAVRFGNVLGSRGSVLPTFIRQLNNGGPLTVTDRRMTRYFMSIPEAVNLVIHAACLTKGDDIFLLRMGETVRIWDIAERVIRMYGLRPQIDIEITEIGIRPGEKLHEELHAENETPNDTTHSSIFKLNGTSDRLESDAFLANIHGLMSIDLHMCDNPLEEIMRFVPSESLPEIN